MKRSQLKRGKPLRADPAKTAAWRQRSRKRLPARSAKRIADDEVWAEVKAAAFKRDNFTCQAPRPWHSYSALGIEPCWGDLDPHHIWPTGDGGPRLVLDNVVTLCRGHHDWAHANAGSEENPGPAMRLGLIRRG